MTINERISKIIEFSKLTPSEFADKIKIQRSSISHVTSGRNKPSLDFIIKIKTQYPEISWDWLINDEGEMLKPTSKDIQSIDEQPKKASIPDLFALIDDENFGIAKQKDKVQSENSLKLISGAIPDKNILSDFQRLEKMSESEPQIPKKKNVKRVILFFDDETFESYEP